MDRYEAELTYEDFMQAGDLCRKVIAEGHREHLIACTTGHPGNAEKLLRQRKAAVFYKAEQDCGFSIARAPKLFQMEIERLAAVGQAEPAKETTP